MINCKSYSNGTCLKFATECVLESDLICGCADIEPMDEEKKPQTNYERIMSKTPEELAFWMAMNLTCCSCPIDLDACHKLEMSNAMSCEEIILDWLKKEETE